MLDYDDYKQLIVNKLYANGLITEELYEKCRKPDYIQDLPYSLHTNDVDKLEERMYAIDDEINRRAEILAGANYRIGVKTRDSERLQKRIDKNNAAIEKSLDTIAGESDKIVKGISKLETKIGKLGDDVDISKIESAIKNFKIAHNNFFELEYTGNNKTTYNNVLEKYMSAHDDLKKTIQQGFDDGLFNKSDLNNSNYDANFKRINTNIGKIDKAVANIEKDTKKIGDNQVDINYIIEEGNTVSKEIDVLDDEMDATLMKYLDNGGNRDIKPGFNQEGHGSKIPELIDELEQYKKESRREANRKTKWINHMLDKRNYKQLIEDVLVEKGLIEKPELTKEYIINIVNDICDDLIKKEGNR